MGIRDAAPASKAAADGDIQSGGAGDACAQRRLGLRDDLQAVDLEKSRNVSEELVVSLSGQFSPIAGRDGTPCVLRQNGDAAVITGRDGTCGTEPNGDIDRLCERMEEIARPDVEGAASEIDTGWGLSLLICRPTPTLPNTLHRHVGQLAVLGFGGQTVSAELRALSREWDLGGAIFFARNVEAPDQVAELAFDLQALAQEIPLLVGVDQEGGRVARF